MHLIKSQANWTTRELVLMWWNTPPVLTDSYIEGPDQESMFLTNKENPGTICSSWMTRNHWIWMTSKTVGANRIVWLQIVIENTVPAGTVSPFGLLNNEEKDILVYFDQRYCVREKRSWHMSGHQWEDHLYQTQDLFRFLESIDF